jgi:hypothetical protein
MGCLQVSTPTMWCTARCLTECLHIWQLLMAQPACNTVSGDWREREALQGTLRPLHKPAVATYPRAAGSGSS